MSWLISFDCIYDFDGLKSRKIALFHLFPPLSAVAFFTRLGPLNAVGDWVRRGRSTIGHKCPGQDALAKTSEDFSVLLYFCLFVIGAVKFSFDLLLSSFFHFLISQHTLIGSLFLVLYSCHAEKRNAYNYNHLRASI